jgi:hypothetical protein
MKRNRTARCVTAACMTCFAVAGLAIAARAEPAALEAILQRCAAAASPQARIDCLEAALADAHGVAGREPDAEPTPAAAAAPAVAPAPSTPPARPTLGEDQIASRERKARNEAPDERMHAQIASHGIIGYRSLELHLDNGQVWRQLSADTQRIRLPDGRPLPVEVWQSRLGGYQMRIHDIDRTIRVERVR